MEEPTLIEGIFITIWFFWTVFAFQYHSRHKSYSNLYFDKIEEMIQITNKWSTHLENKIEDIEYYNRIKSQLKYWSSEESEHKIKKEDVITFLWYAVAFFIGGAGLENIILRIWRNSPFS